MPEIKLDNNNTLEYRPTPWDERVFKIKTIEITSLAFDSIPSGKTLVHKLLTNEKPELCYGRFQSDNLLIKQILVEDGFFPVECQASLHIPSLDKFRIPESLGRRALKLDEANDEDKEQVIYHSDKMFEFSRFHEDPFIDKALANKRMKNWVTQMVNEECKMLVYRLNNSMTSFVFYDIDDSILTLKLGGSISGKGKITPYFFGSVIMHFKNQGIKMVNGVDVSIANTGIFKVYLALNFELRNTYVDYHWHKSRES